MLGQDIPKLSQNWLEKFFLSFVRRGLFGLPEIGREIASTFGHFAQGEIFIRP